MRLLRTSYWGACPCHGAARYPLHALADAEPIFQHISNVQMLSCCVGCNAPERSFFLRCSLVVSSYTLADDEPVVHYISDAQMLASFLAVMLLVARKAWASVYWSRSTFQRDYQVGIVVWNLTTASPGHIDYMAFGCVFNRDVRGCVARDVFLRKQ